MRRALAGLAFVAALILEILAPREGARHGSPAGAPG
jgi:hypothetical protein